MSDFDPCECVWNHENAMQRLINLLRSSQSQDACTDSACFSDDLPGSTAPDGGYSTMVTMMIGWLVMATALFLLRPRSLRHNEGDSKPRPGGDSNPPPPPPPGVH